jgi:4-hydroxythreonine-4-phosphate dehydrogenase
MYLDRSYDAYVVMYHDQGHVPAKLLGFDRTVAATIGTPIRFASVGHGSALAIAGTGRADPSALIAAILGVSGGGS